MSVDRADPNTICNLLKVYSSNETSSPFEPILKKEVCEKENLADWECNVILQQCRDFGILPPVGEGWIFRRPDFCQGLNAARFSDLAPIFAPADEPRDQLVEDIKTIASLYFKGSELANLYIVFAVGTEDENDRERWVGAIYIKDSWTQDEWSVHWTMSQEQLRCIDPTPVAVEFSRKIGNETEVVAMLDTDPMVGSAAHKGLLRISRLLQSKEPLPDVTGERFQQKR